MNFGVVAKHAAAELIYAIDWPTSYLQEGLTISSSSWSIFPEEDGGLSIATGSETLASSITSVKVVGGLQRNYYRLRNIVVISNGEEDIRDITVLIV